MLAMDPPTCVGIPSSSLGLVAFGVSLKFVSGRGCVLLSLKPPLFAVSPSDVSS